MPKDRGELTTEQKGYRDGQDEAKNEFSTIARDVSEVFFGKSGSDYEKARDAGYHDYKEGKNKE